MTEPRLLTIDASKDFTDEQYREMFDTLAEGLTDRELEALLGGVVSNAWLSKYRRGKARLNRRVKDALRFAADDMPPTMLTPAETVDLHAHPDAAVYTTLSNGALGRVVVISDGPDVLEPTRKPWNPRSKPRKSVSLELGVRERLNAYRVANDMSWDEMAAMLEEFIERSNY